MATRTNGGKLKVFALCGVMTFAAAAAYAYTSASYAQREHLLIQWDGIDNAGTGTHDSRATK